jgi:hypothetical protein
VPMRFRRRRCGTRSPSSRHNRCRRLWLTIHPSALQGGVFALQLLQPLGVIGFEPTELVAPPVVRLLGDLQLRAHVGDILAIGQHPIRLGQLAHNLLGRVPLPRCHRDRPSCPQCGRTRLSLVVDQPTGVRAHRNTLRTHLLCVGVKLRRHGARRAAPRCRRKPAVDRPIMTVRVQGRLLASDRGGGTGVCRLLILCAT